MEKTSALFRTFYKFDPTLTEAARVAVVQVLDVTQRESVLIVTNPEEEVHEISLALYDAMQAVGADTVLAVQPTKGQLDFTEGSVLGAIRSAPDVVVSMSANKLAKIGRPSLDPSSTTASATTNTSIICCTGKRQSAPSGRRV